MILKIRRLTAGINGGSTKTLWRLSRPHLLKTGKNDPQSLLTETEKLNAVLSCEKSANYDLQKKTHRPRLAMLSCSGRKYRSSLRSKQPGQLRKDVLIQHKLVVLPGSFLKLDVRVGDAMLACAKAFGIWEMSRRSVLRARDEGGYFGLMQLGREIISSLQVYFWYSSIHSLWLNKMY